MSHVHVCVCTGKGGALSQSEPCVCWYKLCTKSH